MSIDPPDVLPEDLQCFVQQATGLTGWTVSDTRSGDVNRIYTLTHPRFSKALVLRHRTGHASFRYEQGLAKDAAVQALLAGQWQPGGSQDLPDRQDLTAHHALPHNLLWTKGRADALSLQHHIPGPTFVEAGEDAPWDRLGAVMADIHRITISGWHPRLDASVEADGAGARDFSQHITTLLQAEQPEAGNWLAADALDQICRLDPGQHQVAPSLLHNDIHGGNVIACADHGAVLVDWDNACIGAPELDWVKLRFFPLLDGQGLDHRTTAHDRTLEGYLQAGGGEPDSRRLHLYALLWQMRLGNFQHSRDGVSGPVRRAVDLLLAEL
ncbi:MAG: hypothetical protein Alpg2KO_08670 [Alphaproteobacteria bacterium]